MKANDFITIVITCAAILIGFFTGAFVNVMLAYILYMLTTIAVNVKDMAEKNND